METPIKPQRIRQLIILGVVLAAIIALAAGLPNLIVDEGSNVVLENPLNDNVESGGEALPVIGELPVAIFSAITSLIVAGAIYLTIRYRQFRALAKYLAVALVFGLIIYFVINRADLEPDPPPQEAAEFGEMAAEQPEVLSAPEFVTQPAAWIILAISFGVGLLAVAVGIVLFRRWQEPDIELQPLPQLAVDAELTLNEIRGGADIKDAITRCYSSMSRSVRLSRGITRTEGMTPREFAVALYGLGLPQPSVDRLTNLFEMVRYGSHEATQREKLEAVACMEEIIAAIRPAAATPATASRPQPTTG